MSILPRFHYLVSGLPLASTFRIMLGFSCVLCASIASTKCDISLFGVPNSITDVWVGSGCGFLLPQRALPQEEAKLENKDQKGARFH